MASSGMGFCRCAWGVVRRARPVGVWMDMTLVAPALPGVTEAGWNVTDAPVGRPVAERVTRLV